jgi:hypothetical protein
MRTAFLLAAALTVFAQAAPAADDLVRPVGQAASGAGVTMAVSGVLTAASGVEVARWLAGERDTQRWLTDPVSQSHRTGRSWIERHPVLTCALIGAAAGAGVAAAIWGKEGAWVGTYTGGAAGAVVGAIVLK